MKFLIPIIYLLFSTFFFTGAFAASIEKAEMLQDHDLMNEAKKELIDVIFSKARNSKKSRALYMLGNIAFVEKRISVALDTWRNLVSKYPKSKDAIIVKNRISELAEVMGETRGELIKNAIAQSYLQHANFWSEKKSSIFTIDSSWIPHIETAIKWYDKIISEFPKTSAAEIAYKGKIRTLLGWKKTGEYDENQGLKGDFLKYMPKLLEAFQAFEKDFPKSGSLQAFRYQIAQSYWGDRNWDKTKEWLNKVISHSGKYDGFYKDLAQRRLIKVEY